MDSCILHKKQKLQIRKINYIGVETIFSIILLKNNQLLAIFDTLTILSLFLTNRRLHSILQQWRDRFIKDISMGIEAFAITIDGINLPLRYVLDLIRFKYITSVHIPIPTRKHCLPQELCKPPKRIYAPIILTFHQNLNKGWGVFTTQEIPKDVYVGEYTGELISSSEQKRRYAEVYDKKKLNFVLSLREFILDKGNNDVEANDCKISSIRTNIDSTKMGNYTRFFNHSCEPTMGITTCRFNSYIPQFMFCTIRDIKVGEELTFDYGDSSFDTIVEGIEDKFANNINELSRKNRKRCYCGAKCCRKYLPFDPEL